MTLSALDLPSPSDQFPRGLVILLHGWGANAQDLADLSSAFQLPGVRFVLPDAPFPHPYSPSGRMWYDLESQHWNGLRESKRLLSQWLDECIETSGLLANQVILAGFSQGGAMALDVGLERSLAGLVIFSGYLHPQLEQQYQDKAPQTHSVLILHGQQDAVVPYQAAIQVNSMLDRLSIKSELFCLPTMGHQISTAAVQQARSFILSTLTQNAEC